MLTTLSAYAGRTVNNRVEITPYSNILLWEAAAVLLTTEDPDTMLRSFFEKIRESLRLEVYFNFMVSETGDTLELVSTTGIEPETAQSMSRLEFGQAVCGDVALARTDRGH